MNQTAEPKNDQGLQALVVAPRREVKLVQDDSPIAYLMDTARFEHCYRVAQMMARASLIPKHLKGDSAEQTAANCFLVVNQAIRWELDPFAIAPETYEVGGKLGFQGKLVAAVINARGGLSERLSYAFNDKRGDDLEVVVSGKLRGETEVRTVTVNVKEARTPNQMWTKDPQQKLCYTGATKWARRHCPEIMLGVLTDDDLDRMREENRFAQATQVADAKPPTFVSTPPTPAAKRKAPPKEPAPEVKVSHVPTAPDGYVSLDQLDAAQAKAETEKLLAALGVAEVTPEQLLAFYNKNKGTDLKSLSEIPADSRAKLLTLLANPDSEQVRGMKQ